MEDQPYVKFKKLRDGGRLPVYATPNAAGADLFAAEDVVVGCGEWGLVPCGFSMEIPPGWEAQVRPRSGLAAKAGLTVLNAPGTIDADFRGEVHVLLIAHGDSVVFKKGDRVAQMVFAPAPQALMAWTADELSVTSRGAGGFGSTGK